MHIFAQQQHKHRRPTPRLAPWRAGVCALLALTGVTTLAAPTNAIVAAPVFVDIHIHNAPESSDDTNVVAVTVYDIVGISSAPNRQGVVASEREFRLSTYSAPGDRAVILPHAVQQPRERIFDRESDDGDEFGFNIPGQDTTWESVSDEHWGWLNRDVNQYSQDRLEMRRMGETALRESLMIQSLGLGNPGAGANGLLPSANPLLAQPRDVRFGERSRSLLDRELLRSDR